MFTCPIAIGLQMGWRSWYWIAAIPPALFVIIFKIFVLRSIEQQFRFWNPTPDEIAMSKLHSERADGAAGKLEKRFGHPALHSELFTPLLHAKMMPLLPQVYHGRLGHERTSVAGYAGQKMEAQIAPGGIRIAGIEEVRCNFPVAELLVLNSLGPGGSRFRPGSIPTRTWPTGLGQQVYLVIQHARRGLGLYAQASGIRRISGPWAWQSAARRVRDGQPGSASSRCDASATTRPRLRRPTAAIPPRSVFSRRLHRPILSSAVHG